MPFMGELPRDFGRDSDARPGPEPTLDELLDALGKEWAAGLNRLNEFEHLFGRAEHVELLNFVGGAFFGEVQWVLLDDLQLCISRLTDPPQSGTSKNLTVKDSARYKVANCIQAQPVFSGFARLAHGKVIFVSVLSDCRISANATSCARRWRSMSRKHAQRPTSSLASTGTSVLATRIWPTR